MKRHTMYWLLWKRSLKITFVLCFMLQLTHQQASDPSLNWSDEKWKSEVDDILKTDSVPDGKLVTNLLTISKYATIEDNEYFDIEYICKYTEILERFSNHKDKVNISDAQVKECISMGSNVLELDLTDLREAQRTCNSTNTLAKFLTTVMYQRNATLSVNTRNIFAQNAKIKSQSDNVAVVFPPTKAMKVYGNHENFNFIQNIDTDYLAVVLPNHTTSNKLVVLSFNENNTFFHHYMFNSALEGQKIEKHFDVFFESQTNASEKILVKIVIDKKKECHKGCLKYDHISGKLVEQFCTRPSKDYLLFSIKPMQKVFLSIVQTGSDCISYKSVLDPVNIFQSLLTIAGYLVYCIKYIYDRCTKKKTPVVERKFHRIHIIFYQLTAVTFAKYLCMFIFDIRLFEMYYAPTYTCVLIGIFAHYILHAEFNFLFLFMIYASLHFDNKNYYIPTKHLVWSSLAAWLLPFLPIAISELVFFITDTKCYDRRICFPTMTNIYYITSVFVLIPAIVTLVFFAKRACQIDLHSNKNLKYSVFCTVLLFVSVLFTWICFIGMIYVGKFFFILFCIFGILQCLFMCLLTWLCKFVIHVDDNTDSSKYSVTYKFGEKDGGNVSISKSEL